MGNSVQKKKKVQAEKNFSAHSSPSLSREKPNDFWSFGRQDKPKTGESRGVEAGMSVALRVSDSSGRTSR